MNLVWQFNPMHGDETIKEKQALVDRNSMLAAARL